MSKTGMRTHSIRGGGGLRLHVREWGPADGPPILFIHGMSQNHVCWARQYDSPLAEEFRLVAFDLRGHGMSEAPQGPEHYANAQLWADDVAVIIDKLRLDRPVVVGWSYGPFLICDYVRAYGADRIGAINFVGGAVQLNPSAFGTLIGPGFLDHFGGLISDDLPTTIATTRSFVRAWAAKQLPEEDLETAMCSTMAVPSAIRAHLGAREIDCDDVLRTLTHVPVLVSHGTADTVVLPAMAEHVVTTCPAAKPSWYDGAGHVPFLEAPQRFNSELRALALSTLS